MRRITAVVLAGGKSRRLGLYKALLRLDDETLLEVTVKKVATLSDEAIVAVSGPLPYRLPGARLVADVYPGCGPLGGIHAGLTAASNFYSLVVACDMPFLNLELLQYIVELAPGCDVVIPRLGAYLEPLHAIYSKDCLRPIERQIEAGNLKISDLLSEVQVRYLEGDEIEHFDPKHFSFFNINTAEDLERARKVYHSLPDC